jgi:biopolymer transport protein ExbD
MAEIIQNEGGGKGGKVHAKKHSTHIDMTPMVDLACLLITFFMLTTAFAKPKAMEIVLPEKDDKPDKNKPQIEIPKSRTYNVIMTSDNKIYWYVGAAKEGDGTQLQKTDYSKDGIRKVILERNKKLYKSIDSLNKLVITGKITLHKDSLAARIKKMKSDDKAGPIVLIKADDKVKYRNIVDMVDEMAICNVARYAIVAPTPIELKMLETAPK